MKRINLLLLLILSFSGYSQKYELGKVTVAELQQKRHPNDTAANAAVIFKVGRTYFEPNSQGYFAVVSEIIQKVKIYKKEGYEHATVQVPYYTGSKGVRLYFDDAATYNLVGGKVEKTKLKSDGEFSEQVNESYSYKKIVLPNVKEGSIIEYKYVIKSDFYTAFPDFYFQGSIPIDHVELKVQIPQYFVYRRFMKGFVDIKASPETAISNSMYNYNESQVIYSANNIKALKEESHVYNIDNYTSMVQYELASTNFPSSGVEKYSTDWESVAKKIYDDKDFGNELNYKSYFEKDLEPILKTVTSRDDRINAVFEFVKSRMNWNERNSYYCKVGVKKAYNEKVGNTAEINLMLTAMLRYAEIKANPVLVSTRSNGIALYPNRTAYNYVIAAVELDNKNYLLLDATSKSAVPNILPMRALNWTGRMIRPDKTSDEIDLMPKLNSKEIVNIIATLDSEGNVSGKTREQYFDYNAFVFREYNLKTAKDIYLEKIEKKYGGLEIEEYATANDKDLTKPMVENFNFKHTNISERIGDKLYFSPMLYYAKTENPFKEENREYPVDFSFPYQDKYSISITLPEGYEVESLPKPIAVNMEDNIGSFKYNISSSGKQIQLTASIDINHSVVSPIYYVTLKDFYKKMIEKQNEKVVLKKIQ